MSSIWTILVVILLVVSVLDFVRSIGTVSRPLAFLIMFLAALEAIMLFRVVPTPGTIGLVGWVAVLSTAIFCFSLERVRVAGGPRVAALSLILLLVSGLLTFLSLGLINVPIG